MRVSVGTFNLNNLFSRFNFTASIEALRSTDPSAEDVSVTYTFDDSSDYVLRTFQGRLVKGKDPEATTMLARRILSMNVDVLAVQEVEDIEVLRRFNRDQLGGLYEHSVLVEGNDRRLIDVGVLSKLPLGAITSFQTATHPDGPDDRILSRDLLAVEVLNSSRRRKLFTLYNTHLKSHYVDFREDPVAGKARNDLRRQRQSETIARLIGDNERRGSRFILTGDMNDPVDSPFLAPMLTVDGARLVNALVAPAETRPSKREREGPGPQTTAWTYRRNPPGTDEPPVFSLYDQVWLSQRLAGHLQSAHIDRRTRHGGDGSDHDPAWVMLTL